MVRVPSFILGTLFLYARGLFYFSKFFSEKSTYPRGTFAARRASPTPYYNIFKQPLSSVFQKFFENFFRSIDKNISIKKY